RAPPRTHIYTLSLHDALPISQLPQRASFSAAIATLDQVAANVSAADRDHSSRGHISRGLGQASPCSPHVFCARSFGAGQGRAGRSEEHTSELQSRENLVCRLL